MQPSSFERLAYDRGKNYINVKQPVKHSIMLKDLMYVTNILYTRREGGGGARFLDFAAILLLGFQCRCDTRDGENINGILHNFSITF